MILVDDEPSLLEVSAFDDDHHHQQQQKNDNILLPTTTQKDNESVLSQDEMKAGNGSSSASSSTIFSYLNNISSSPSRITKTVTKGLSGAAPALNLYNGRRMTGLDSKKNV